MRKPKFLLTEEEEKEFEKNQRSERLLKRLALLVVICMTAGLLVLEFIVIIL